MNTKQKNISLVLLLISLAFFGVVFYSFWSQTTLDNRIVKSPEATPKPTETPDNNIVQNESTEATLMIGESATLMGVQITPIELIEDSRCPVDVQCIQAGTVRVKANLLNGIGRSEQIFTLDKPVVTKEGTITLVGVLPSIKKSNVTVLPRDYSFTFAVTN